MLVWRLGKTLPGQFDAKDMTGEGAYRYGGRWNSIGMHAVYAALTPATAVLESIVHLGQLFNPIDRYLIAIEIPDEIWNDDKTGVIRAKRLPKHWEAIPHHQATMLYGDRWIKTGKQLGMIVPSAVLEEESNIILNPRHPSMKRLKIRKSRPFVFDPRLASPLKKP
jgi:RES domain-containing protein